MKVDMNNQQENIQMPPVFVNPNNPVRMVVDSSGKELYLRQVECLISKDVDRLINENYNNDAVLISASAIIRGKSALKKHFTSYLSKVNIKKVRSTDAFVETDDALLFEATIESDQGTARVYDAFVLRAGKISYHFTGVK
jgi:hypothetical protein